MPRVAIADNVALVQPQNTIAPGRYGGGSRCRQRSSSGSALGSSRLRAISVLLLLWSPLLFEPAKCTAAGTDPSEDPPEVAAEDLHQYNGLPGDTSGASSEACDAPRLPKGWYKRWDKRTEREYFVNSATNRRYWELPETIQEQMAREQEERQHELNADDAYLEPLSCGSCKDTATTRRGLLMQGRVTFTGTKGELVGRNGTLIGGMANEKVKMVLVAWDDFTNKRLKTTTIDCGVLPQTELESLLWVGCDEIIML